MLLQFNQKSTAEERDPEIHQTKKGNQWYYPCAEGCAYGMKVHNRYAEAKGYGVDKGTGLNHSVETTAANVHELTPAADLLQGEEAVVYADAGYQGIEKREEVDGKTAKFRGAIRPVKRRVLPETPDGRLENLVETAKAHIRAKMEYPLRVIKQQFGFQKTALRGMAKNRCKINVLAALTNLFMASRQLLLTR